MIYYDDDQSLQIARWLSKAFQTAMTYDMRWFIDVHHELFAPGRPHFQTQNIKDRLCKLYIPHYRLLYWTGPACGKNPTGIPFLPAANPTSPGGQRPLQQF